MRQESYDIANAMLQHLQAEDFENTTHTKRLATALEYLNKAANILDNSQDFHNAERITRVIEKLAKGV